MAITINGHTDGTPTITLPDGDTTSATDMTLPETAGATAGTFTVQAQAGIATLQVGGTTLTLADLGKIDATHPVTVAGTTDGTMVLTGFNPLTGVVSYTYDPNVLHNTNSQAIIEHVPLSVTDANGVTGANSVDISITDSTPTAVNDTNAITEDATPNTVTGNVYTNDTIGADGAAIGGAVTAGTFASANGYGSLLLHSDGSYTYTLDNTNPTVNALNTNSTPLTDNYTYTITDGDGSTTTATLAITINGQDDAPVAINSAVTTNEDTSYAYKLADFHYSDVDSPAITAIRIDSLPVLGDLYYNGVQVTTSGLIVDAANIGLLTFKPDLNQSGSNQYTHVGVGDQFTDYANFKFSVSDGTVWSASSGTMAVDVIAVADAPTLNVVASSIVSQVINASNVTSGVGGFHVSALNPDGTASTVSIHSASPSGFGVTGATNGADDTELGYLDGKGSEKLAVTFDAPQNFVNVSFAWLSSTETAAYTFYYQGAIVGQGTQVHGSDGIDPVTTLAPANGAQFDKIVFSAPASGDDYLIHSITYGQAQSSSSSISVESHSSVNLNISAALTDTDGSESLKVTLKDIPAGTTITDGVHTYTAPTGSVGSTDITSWNLGHLSMNTPAVTQTTTYTLTVEATSTEYSNGSTASTDQAIKVTVYNDSYAMLRPDSGDVYESALSNGTNPSSTGEVTTGNLYSNDTLPSGVSLANVTIAGGTTTSANGQMTVTTAQGNILVVNTTTGAYTYTLLHALNDYTPIANSAITYLDTFTVAADVSSWGSNGTLSGGTMQLAAAKTATQTFAFGATHAGETVTIHFDANSSTSSYTDVKVSASDGSSLTATSNVTNDTFTATLDANGSVTVNIQNLGTHNVNIDNVEIDVPNGRTPVDSLTDSFTYTMNDTSGNVYSSNLNVVVHDDKPVIDGNAAISIAVPASINTNLVLTLDVSGSMNDIVTGTSTKLALAKQALINTIDAYAKMGTVNVELTLFNTTALNKGWMTVTQAETYINSLSMDSNTYIMSNGQRITGLNTGVNTNYEAAVQTTASGYGTAPTADQTKAYFISDGAPTTYNSDTTNKSYLDTNYLNNWGTFVNSHSIDLTVIGIGNSVPTTYLNEVQDVETGKSNTPAIVVTDVTQLSNTIISGIDIIHGTLYGADGTTGIHFGADGGHVASIEYLGANGANNQAVTYTYDPSNASQTITLSHGVMTLDFTTGNFTYTPTVASASDALENFSITVVDNDGGSVTNTVNLLVGVTFTYDGSTAIVADSHSYSFDTIDLKAGVNLTTIDFGKLDNIEQIDLTPNGNHTISNLTLSAVLDMTQSAHTLEISGTSTDTVHLLNSTSTNPLDKWTQTSTVVENGNTYDVYTNTANTSVTVKVEDQINHNVM